MSPIVIAVVAALSVLFLFTLVERLLSPVLARRAVARILKTKRTDPRALENPKYGTLSDDGDRLRLDRSDGRVELPWKRVEEVRAFKRDLFTTDLICVAFKREGRNEYIEVHEEMAGYHDLLQTLPSRLPGFTLAWFSEVAFPAFETNHRTIWKRSPNQPP
jgi:hypothetical protein